jgi:hypothetical protein
MRRIFLLSSFEIWEISLPKNKKIKYQPKFCKTLISNLGMAIT